MRPVTLPLLASLVLGAALLGPWGCANRREPAALSSEAETREIILDPAELAWDEAAGTVSFTEDSQVQKAAYTRYVLDLASVEAALGGRPQAPVTVSIAVSRQEERVETPDDPMLPSPEGGFRITTVYGHVTAP